jgi:hypothetical protein
MRVPDEGFGTMQRGGAEVLAISSCYSRVRSLDLDDEIGVGLVLKSLGFGRCNGL